MTQITALYHNLLLHVSTQLYGHIQSILARQTTRQVRYYNGTRLSNYSCRTKQKKYIVHIMSVCL